MPYSAIPNPLPANGRRAGSLEVTIPGETSGSTWSIGFGLDLYMPGADPVDEGVVDDYFQGVLDALAALPGVTSVTANKITTFGQTVTPTEAPE